MAEAEDVIDLAGGVGRVFADNQLALMIEQAVEDMRGLASMGGDDLGVERREAIDDMGVEQHAGFGAVALRSARASPAGFKGPENSHSTWMKKQEGRQRLLPQLFVRSPDGVLVSYDSRPFSGVSEISGTVSGNLHTFGMIRAPSAALDPNDAEGLNWGVGINHTVVLDDRIRLTPDSPIVDVISDPLNLSAATPSRHRIVLQATASGRQFAANAFRTWKSGYRGGQGVSDSQATRIAALALFNADFFYGFGHSDDASNPSRFRVKISVDNLFNARPRFANAKDTGSNAYGILSDPLGRVIALSLRKVF